MIIYKYTDEEGTLEILKNNSVLLRTPLEYNDPFDCLFFVDDAEKEKAYKLFLNYQLFTKFYEEMNQSNKKPVRFKALANIFRKDIQFEASDIKKTRKYTMQPYLRAYYKFASKYLNKNDSELRLEFKQMISNVLKNMRSLAIVSCFGSENNSVLMWAHYANKHKGACIAFEIDDKDFKKVFYKRELPVFRLEDVLSIIFGHKFLEEEVDSDKEEYQFILEPLLTKSSDWKYESEIRCVYSANKRDPKIYESVNKKGETILLLKMPPIQAIYLGCNASSDFINQVKSICNEIPLFKMVPNKTQYGLDFKPE